jgi:dolichol kinase
MLAMSALFLGFIGAVELIKRKFSISSEITRRVVHIGAGLCTIIDFYYVPGWPFVILITTSIGIIGFSYLKNFFTSVHNVTRHTYGEIFLPFGSLSAYFISLNEPTAFLPALLIMTFADSLAGLTSDFLKQPRKIWRGSLVFFVVALVILLITTRFELIFAIGIALAVTAVERYSPKGSDNLTVPAVTALLVVLL